MGSEETRERAIQRAVRAGRSRRRRRAIATVLVVLGLGAGLAARRNDDGEPRRTAQATVDAFFAAQREHDCVRLVELMAELSWSDHGRRTRSEFLLQCEDALEGFESIDRTGDYFANTDDGQDDRATVESPSGVHDGTLVREDGDWKVVTDPDVLTIGRSPEQTVQGYLAAFDDGDCETMLDHLSAGVDEAAFLDDCNAEAAVRRTSGEPRTKLLHLSITDDNGVSATATVAFADNALEGDDVVALKREGLEWVLDDNQTRPPHRAGPPFVQEHYIGLRARLLDHLAGQPCGTDSTGGAIDGPNDGEPAALRYFIACQVTIELRETDSRLEAGDLARVLASQVAGEPLPTVEDLAAGRRRNRAPEAAPGELEAYVAARRPNEWAPVPGQPDANGIRTLCHTDGCDGTVATLAFGTYVVLIRMSAESDLAVTGRLLRQQTAQL